MAESSDFEKKGVAVNGALADDRLTTGGQVYASERSHVGLNNEREYGESQCNIFGCSESRRYSCSLSALVRKLDMWLLPFLSMMYFFNSIDRVGHTINPERTCQHNYH